MALLRYLIEVLFAAGLFANSLLFIPQMVRIIQKQHADDVSLTTFAGFNIINFLTVLHGYLHHDLILTIGASCAFVINTGVTLLIIWYRYIAKRRQI